MQTTMNVALRSPGSAVAMQSEQQMFEISQPHHNDVLCGRGVTTNRHPGNESFRSLVGLNKELYVTSTKRAKMAISRSIVEAVRSMNPPGRFLEKDPATSLWSDIGDRKAIEKTSQALRDGAATLRKQLSEDMGDPDFLKAVFDVDETETKKLKDKAKPSKPRPVKKGHRRTKSNPDKVTKTAARRASAKHAEPASPAAARSSSLPSHPASPGARPHLLRTSSTGQERPSDFRTPSTPSPPPMLSSYPFGAHGAFSRCHSFDPAAFHQRPPPEVQRTWSQASPTPRRHHSHSYPSPGNHRSPGARLLSPSSRPPISPVSRPWSSRSFSYGTGGGHLRSSPVNINTPYSNGELAVPSLNRERSTSSRSSQRMCASPMSPDQMSSSPPSPGSKRVVSSAMSSRIGTPPLAPPHDFSPPALSPRRSLHDRNMKRDSESVSTTGSTKENMSSSTSSRSNRVSTEGASPRLVVNTMMVDSRADKPAVEESLPEDFTRDLAVAFGLDGNNEESDNPASDVFRSFSPLPINGYGPENLMDISDDLLQLPIAPVGPHDGAATNNSD